MVSDLNAIRVVIADEQVSFRKALRTFLEPERDLTIVGEASEARNIPALTGVLKPDVLLIEVSLFHAVRSRAEILPGVRTVVTVPAPERTDIIRAFLQGARAIVPRLSAPHVWPESIRTVTSGQYWMGSESIAVLVQALRESLARGTDTKPQKDYRLTRREVEIIGKIANGHSNKEVGQAFLICERTVKHHLSNIFSKIGVSSRLELALFAVNNWLLEQPSGREPMSVDDHDSPNLAGSAD